MNKFDPIKFLVERLREINLNKGGNNNLDLSLEKSVNEDLNDDNNNDNSAKNMEDLGDIE